MLEWLFGKKKQQPKQQKPKKSPKEEEAEDKWMYDFMVQFLSSPIWRVSILDFVDNKCIVFDNEEENKFEYTIIHNEFKELVGNLVDGMMEEIGMSQQKLAQIIERGFESKERKLFNQLLLADDFLRFKELMVKRNKALQEQAIKALQEGQLKSSIKNQKGPTKNAEQQLLKQSQRLSEERQRKLQQEQEEMVRRAIQMSRLESKQSQAIRELERKAVDQVREEKQTQQRINLHEQQLTEGLTNNKLKASKLDPIKSSKPTQSFDLPPLRGTLNKKDQFDQKPVQKAEETKQQTKPQTEETKNQSQTEAIEEKQQKESMEDRKQRLMAQRQKIRKQKEEQRKKQLEQEAQQTKERQQQPVIQSIVLQEDGFYDNAVKKQAGEGNSVSQEELKRRKELMNRIKNRIIDDF